MIYLGLIIANKIFGESLKAERWAKPIGYAVTVATLAVVLLVAGLFLRGYYFDTKIDKTAQKINELKIKDKEVEAGATAKEERVKNAEKVVEEIKEEKNVSTEDAIKALCEVYPESELCKK